MISIAKIFNSRNREKERSAPRWVIGLLLGVLFLQLAWASQRPPPVARAEDFSAPPSLAVLRLAALGDSIAFARMVMLWVQNFDNQPGLAVPFRNLDYEALAHWLERVLALDPRSEYPIHAAWGFYTPVPDKQKSLRMLTFLHERFREEPKTRWRWLALAAVNARHRWKEKDLSLAILNEIHTKSKEGSLPAWVRGIYLSILREEGALESARLWIGGLIHNGEITDPGELQYLHAWLERLEAEAAAGH
ncbi:MAG: hypothetical protein H7835_05020 [Magnetococcus sp. XQGC-1]